MKIASFEFVDTTGSFAFGGGKVRLDLIRTYFIGSNAT